MLPENIKGFSDIVPTFALHRIVTLTLSLVIESAIGTTCSFRGGFSAEGDSRGSAGSGFPASSPPTGALSVSSGYIRREDSIGLIRGASREKEGCRRFQ